MPEPSTLRRLPNKKVSLGFFKEGLSPAWEEKAHKGRFAWNVPKSVVDNAWRLLLWLCCANDIEIGESSNPIGQINGVIVGPGTPKKGEDASEPVYRIEIWATDGSPAMLPNLQNKLIEHSKALFPEFAETMAWGNGTKLRT